MMHDYPDEVTTEELAHEPQAESILLSDEQLKDIPHCESDATTCDKCGAGCPMVAKAAAIHAVQYMEEACTEHLYNDSWVSQNYHRHRYDCPKCREKYHKELGI
jgi:hypothetical protein